MSRNILCVVEFDNYPEHVVDRAIWLAKSRDCALHLLVCDPITDLLGEAYVYLLESQNIANSIRESQDEAIDKLVAKVEDAGVTVAANRETDKHVADVIREAAEARQPRYVIKGTHYHSPSERGIARRHRLGPDPESQLPALVRQAGRVARAAGHHCGRRPGPCA